MDLATACLERAYDPRGFAALLQLLDYGFCECRPDGQHISDPHIEYAIHLVNRDIATILEEREDWWDFPCRCVNDSIEIGWQHPGKISRESSAGDMRHGADNSLHLVSAQQFYDGLGVDSSRLQQHITQQLIAKWRIGSVEPERSCVDNAAHQAVTIAVDAAAFETDEDVASTGADWVNGAVEFHNSNGEARDIEITFRVDIRHLGALATDQRASRDLASPCNALNNLRRCLRILAVKPEVIKKEQRFGALNDEVIDVHRHTVDSNSVEYPQIGCEFDLGSNAIGACHKDRILVVPLEYLLVEVEPKHPGECAVLSHHPLPVGSPNRWLDELDEPIAGINIDTGLSVGHRL